MKCRQPVGYIFKPISGWLVCEGKTANTPMYVKSVAGVILRDCADNHIKERVNQSLTTDQRTTMSPIKNELLPSPKVVTHIHPEH
jgi:hypothetical protein